MNHNQTDFIPKHKVDIKVFSKTAEEKLKLKQLKAIIVTKPKLVAKLQF